MINEQPRELRDVSADDIMRVANTYFDRTNRAVAIYTREAGADTLVTAGAVQSNHARQSAAAAARLGMGCELILERPEGADEDYLGSGNALLDRVLDARVHPVAEGADVGAETERVVAALAARGRRPCAIPVGGSNALGALGYARCALEILEQSAAAGVGFAEVVHASGSAGTQAGLLAGLGAARSDLPVLGICVSRGGEEQAARVEPLAHETLALLDPDARLPAGAARAAGDWVGPGYGRPTEAMREAVERAARTEGLLLDPVYTGKAAAGLVDLARAGRWRAGEHVLFVHTGGAVALFAYPSVFDPR